MLRKKLLEFIVTFGFVGKIKFAPGTFGSFAAFPLMYLILLTISKSSILTAMDNLFDTPQSLSVLLILGFITLCLFFVGVIASSAYINQYSKQEDPQEIVIDEVVGQMLTSVLCFFGNLIIATTPLINQIGFNITNLIFIFILPFILFRTFDILKPWPIDYVDANVKVGLGVMLDDILAAIFAAVTFYTIVFCILNFYS
jgi:phosphatidylglycerophosphatase A